MRLLLAITELGIGGAERVVLELESGAAAAGHDVAVAAASGPLERDAARFLRLPATGRSPLALARTGRRLAGIVRSFAPDLVHAHNPRMTSIAVAAVRLAGPGRRPCVLATHHGVAPERVPAAARALRLADHVVCVSPDLTAELSAHRIPGQRLSTIPNGVAAGTGLDDDERARLDAELALGEGPVVAAVGRLVEQKAHHRLVDAARTVHAELPGSRVLIVGDGPLRGELEAQIRANGLENVVTLTGPRPDARAIIARADVVAFSSDWEGLSVVALEALAAGVPLVSTAVAGVTELASAGAAVSVPLSADALAAALLDLLRDPARRRELSAAGRRLHAERFSTDRMVESHLALYDRLLAKRAQPSRG